MAIFALDHDESYLYEDSYGSSYGYKKRSYADGIASGAQNGPVFGCISVDVGLM
jgi:hypothetical protein